MSVLSVLIILQTNSSHSESFNAIMSGVTNVSYHIVLWTLTCRSLCLMGKTVPQNDIPTQGDEAID